MANSVVVVTGGGAGIGAAASARLAEDGFRVVVADRDPAAAAATAEAIAPRAACPPVALELDVTDRAAVDRAFGEVIRDVGLVFALVNNAGIDVVGRFADSDPADWRRIVDVNLYGTLGCTQAVVSQMVEAGAGRIVNIASDAGRVGSSGEVVYSATKGGVIAFSKALAREVAAAGVTVNVVCPGPTETALLDSVGAHNPRLRESLARAIPMRRVGRPDDVAGAVSYFVGESSSFVTGQTLSVSGGLTMAG